MAITLNGTTGVTTPAVSGDGSGLTALPSAQLTGTVATSQIADANVTTAKIADANVTTAKIADANVITAKIADANVTQGKLADQSVNEAKMQVSNAPTNGYMLTAQSGNTGGLTWAAAPTSSTAYAAVGTYTWGRPLNAGSMTQYSVNDTGSNIYPMGGNDASANVFVTTGNLVQNGVKANSLSGTWRAMSPACTRYGDGYAGLWVRIS